MVKSRSFKYAAVALILMCSAMILSFPLLQPDVINPDAANLSHMAMHLLDGQTPFVDYFDINSPMIVYVSAIPVLVADFLNTDFIPVFSLFVITIIIWGTANTHLLLRQLSDQASLISYLIPLYILIHTMGIYLTPEFPTFGEREHLFVVTYVPFLLLRWMKWEGIGRLTSLHTALIGLTAAIVTTFKPHFLLIVAIPEVYFLLNRRAWRSFLQVEWLIFMGGGALYALHFLLLPRESLDVLFNYSVPLFQYGYHAWNPVDGPLNYVAVVLLGFPYTILSPLLFLWVFWGSRKRANSPLSNLRFPLALAMSAAFIVFVLQEKGWRYHLIPQVLLTWVLILVMFVDDTAPGIYRDARITIQIRAFVAIAIAAPMLLLYVVNIATHPGIHSEIEAVIRAQTNPDDKVLIIHTEVHEWYGVYVRTRHLAASRYLTGFPIALIYANERDQEGTSPYHTPQEYSDFEVRYLTELAADIQENRPPLIFVQTRCQKCPAGFLVNEYIEGAEPLQAVMDNYIAFGEFDHSDLTSLIGYCLVGVDCEP